MGVIIHINKELDNGLTLSNIYMNIHEIHVIKRQPASVPDNDVSNLHSSIFEFETKFKAYTSREACQNGKACVDTEGIVSTSNTLPSNDTVFTQAYKQLKLNFYEHELDDVLEN
tara:strand:+ start:512 stop:853 length:342 start_codon:yes stop_codon:yes gene_type:complete